MNYPPLPDPTFPHVAPYPEDWLDVEWEKAHPQGEYQEPPTNLESESAPPTRKHSRELTGCEMILVVLGGSLIFVGFLLPISVLAGLFCFIVALGLSAYRKA